MNKYNRSLPETRIVGDLVNNHGHNSHLRFFQLSSAVGPFNSVGAVVAVRDNKGEQKRNLWSLSRRKQK